MQVDIESAVKQGLEKEDEKRLDAAALAVAELLAQKDIPDLKAAAAVFGSDQVSELAGFLWDSMDCKALQDCCAGQHFDAEQAREWGLDRDQYQLALAIALVAHKIERERERLGPC